MNLPSLSSLRSLLPGSSTVTPGSFQASDPASQGGASAPLLWLAIALVVNFGAVADAAAFWGWPPSVAFMNSATAQTAVVAVLVPLIGLLLNYRSRNKEAAADVTKTAIAAQRAQAPQQAGAQGAPQCTECDEIGHDGDHCPHVPPPLADELGEKAQGAPEEEMEYPTEARTES
jgi:hypothetical protein